MTGLEPALYVHNEAAGRALLGRHKGARPLFCCVVGYTAICELPGISAAGATPEVRRFTAPADVETLAHGRARCIDGIPSNPLGPPGPVVITRAALRLADIPFCFVDAGLLVEADAPCHQLGRAPGLDIRLANGVDGAADLFAAGRVLGRELGAGVDYLVLGESVPGGTTTALALLLALGFDARGRVSSSSNQDSHQLKNALVDQALTRAWPNGRPTDLDPLAAARAIGDPMQPAAAGLALGALERCPVLLAGGTQMAAVLALMTALEQRAGREVSPERLAIVTTRWVATDPAADLTGLAKQIGPVPVMAVNLSFATSRNLGLRRYEEFLVKEGVGAGGIALAALLQTGLGPTDLIAVIEEVCDELRVG